MAACCLCGAEDVALDAFTIRRPSGAEYYLPVHTACAEAAGERGLPMRTVRELEAAAAAMAAGGADD